MKIRKIIKGSVVKMSSAIANLKRSERTKSTRSARIILPPTNLDWHNDFEAKTEVTDPAHFIISLRPIGGLGQHDWQAQVLDALNAVCQAILNAEDIPVKLIDSKSGEVLGEVVILDRVVDDTDWDWAMKTMEAEIDKSEPGSVSCS